MPGRPYPAQRRSLVFPPVAVAVTPPVTGSSTAPHASLARTATDGTGAVGTAGFARTVT
jgi:hypothetical protein